MSENPQRRDINPFFGIIFDQPDFTREVDVVPYKSGVLRPDANNIHLHWLDWLLHARFSRRFEVIGNLIYSDLIRQIDSIKRSGGRLIWTAHNTRPHDFSSEKARNVFGRWKDEICSRVDTVVVMSPDATEEILKATPSLRGAEFKVIPHPHYRDFFAKCKGDKFAEYKLDIPDGSFLIASVGFMRPYKRLPQLLRSFQAIAKSDEYLILAGQCEESLQKELLAISGTSRNIFLHFGHLSDGQYADLVRQANLSIMNFGSILNSGSVIASLSVDTPVLAPSKGALTYLQSQVGSEWISLFEDELEEQTLRNKIDELRAHDPQGQPDLSFACPGEISRAYMETYA